tara:strand:- start:47232 stop:47681 length:450 start_codon:yes stop_codon:yes gene_type:complete
MAGAAISIDFEFNDDRVLKALRKLADAGADMEPAFIDIGESLSNSTRERFEAQESPDGEPWAALNPKYQARKKKNADKILVLEGFMRDTMAYNTDSHGLEFGTNRIQGATMQFGDTERNIVARPFLGISTDDEQMILDTLNDHFEYAMK